MSSASNWLYDYPHYGKRKSLIIYFSLLLSAILLFIIYFLCSRIDFSRYRSAFLRSRRSTPFHRRITARLNRRRAGALNALPVFSVVSQPPKRGLDTLVIASLPTFIVDSKGDVADTECVVCLGLFEENDTARMLPNCKHVFHMTCVDTWLATTSTCPVCRTEVEPRIVLEPEPREGPVSVGVQYLVSDLERQ